MAVPPLAGHLTDRCTSPWGLRRPFIAASALAIAHAVLTIGYSSDIGFLLGDSPESDAAAKGDTRVRVGVLLLDVANNLIQGPCRALLVDFTGKLSFSGHFL